MTGGGMTGAAAYATVQQLLGRYPERDLIAITDPDGEAVNVARVEGALADASRLVDAYLAGRYAVPLEIAPAILAGPVCDIAVYALQTLRPKDDIEDARRRRDDAVKFLEAVQAGKAALPGVTERAAQPAGLAAGAGASSRGAVLSAGPRRAFTRDTLSEF